MVKLQLLVAVLGLIIITQACHHINRNGNVMMSFANSGNDRTIVVNNDSMSLEIKYSGDLEFNEEETAIARMSPGGYLEYRRNDRRVLVESDSYGEITYEYYIDRVQLEPYINGKKFLAEAIREMIGMGIGANGRIERKYEEGGVPLLLREVVKMKADNVKRMYFEYMLQSDSLSSEDMTEISQKIGRLISSDNDKKIVLEKVPGNYLEDTLTAAAYFEAVKSIRSDNDKVNVLKNILNQPVAKEAFAPALEVTATLHADKDKANLLKKFMQNESFPLESYDRLVEVTGSLHSDNDKANVLKIIIEKEIVDSVHFNKLLETIVTINNDNDKTSLFNKIIGLPLHTDEQWKSLIIKAASISSNNVRAKLLAEIQKKFPTN